MIIPEQLLTSRTVLDGKILRVSVDEVRLPDGNTATREVVRHPGAVAVLAVNERDEVILVEQYRHACARTLLEVPAGKLDVDGEAPSQCALRELAEETPYSAQSVALIYVFYPSAGFSDEKMYLFRADGVCADSVLCADEDEFITVHTLGRDAARAALRDGRIADAKTLVALQYWLAQGKD